MARARLRIPFKGLFFINSPINFRQVLWRAVLSHVPLHGQTEYCSVQKAEHEHETFYIYYTFGDKCYNRNAYHNNSNNYITIVQHNRPST